MTEGQRERILRSLLGDDVPKMDEQTRKTLEGIAAEHLLAIEPVIDEIIHEERLRAARLTFEASLPARAV